MPVVVRIRDERPHRFLLGKNAFPPATVGVITPEQAQSISGNLFAMSTQKRTPYISQWDFDVSHTFGREYLVDVAYIGSQSHFLNELSVCCAESNPVGAKNSSSDLLNTPVSKFDAVDVDPGGILTGPADFIPELAARLRPKTSATPQPSGTGGSVLRGDVPAITLHTKNTTVRQILNAASEATEQFPPNHPPLGWTYLFQPEPASPSGGKHSWAFLFSAPRSWKKQDAAKRN